MTAPHANDETPALDGARAPVLVALTAVEQHWSMATSDAVELLLSNLDGALEGYVQQAQLRHATRSIVSEPILVALRTALSAALDSRHSQRIASALDELREELAEHAFNLSPQRQTNAPNRPMRERQ